VTLRPYTLFATICQHHGCGRKPELLGFCDEHYQESIDIRHQQIEMEGLSQVPWECFENEREWREYQVMAVTSRRQLANPCLDCSPEYRDRMVLQHRCRHPETVFISGRGDGMVGINGTHLQEWSDACAGKTGKVVNAPSVWQRIKFMEGQ
jgi:hypothetical protein